MSFAYECLSVTSHLTFDKGVQVRRVSNSGSTLTSFVTMGKILSLSGPQFSHLIKKRDINKSYPVEYCGKERGKRKGMELHEKFLICNL